MQQVLQDENGDFWIEDGQGGHVQVDQSGAPIGQGGPVTVGNVDPGRQYEGPKAAADLRKTQVDTQGSLIRNEGAQFDNSLGQRKAPAEVRRIEAEARLAEAKAAQAAEGKATQTAESRAKALKGFEDTRLLDQAIAEIETKYKAGPGGTKWYSGFQDYLPTDANTQFDDAGNSVRALVKGVLQFTGQENNTPRESEMNFGPYIPNSDNFDGAIDGKIERLKRLRDNGYERAVRQLGGVPGRDGEIIPVPAGETITPEVIERVMTAPQLGIADRGADTQSVPVPPEMQQEYAAFRAQWNQNPDVGAYVKFREDQDRKYGYTPNSEAYRADASSFAEILRKGGDLKTKAIPAVETPLEGMDAWRNSAANNPLGAALIGAGNAASLGGLDEITGAVNSTFGGGSLEDEIALANAGKQGIAEANPWSYLAGEFGAAGGIGGLTAKALPKAANILVGNGKRTLGTGAALGSVNGGLEMNDNRALGVGLGGTLGAAGGVLGQKVIAPGVEKLASSQPAQAFSQHARALANTIRPNSVKPNALPAVTGAQRAAYPVVKDQMGEVQSKLAQAQELGLPYSLADASPELRTLAGSVSRRSQNARALAEETFDPRHRDQAGRAHNAIESNLATTFDPSVRQQELRTAGSTVAAPFYTQANNRAAPISNEIESFLQTDTGKKALREARTIAENEGRDPLKMGFDLDDQGNVLLANKPSFETLDLVKRGIDSQIYNPANTNPLTGQLNTASPMVRSLENFRKNFVSALDNVNPKYPEARAAYAPYAKASEAVTLGQKAFGNRVKPRDMETAVGGMDDLARENYQGGFATSMSDKVDDMRLSGNPYEAVYGSTSQQQKVNALFPDGADKFKQTYDLERDMAATRHETLGGSPTAARMAADEQFGNRAMEMGADLGADILGGGGAVTSARMLPRMAQWTRDAARLGVGKQAEKRADSLAPMLFDTDPMQSQAVLKQLEDYVAARIKRQQAARNVGGLIGAGVPSVLISE